MCHNFKSCSICNIDRSREINEDKIFGTIISENVSELIEDINEQFQEAHKTPTKINAKNL